MTALRNLWQMLTSGQRRAAVALLAMMVCGTALEMIGIGLALPVIALMSTTSVELKYPAVGPLLNALGNPTQERLVIGGMLLLIGVFAVKGWFLGFVAWRQAHFVFDVQASLSHRLFIGYLREPYSFHLQRNSAELIQNATGQANVVATMIHQGLIATAELLVVAGICTMLVAVAPAGVLLVGGTLGLAGWGFAAMTRSRSKAWGEAYQLHERMRVQHLQQGLAAAKDIKVLGREEEFIAQYRSHNEGAARVGQRQSTVQQMPRLFLELLAIVGLAGTVLVLIARGSRVEVLLPTMGLCAAAAFRLMPSINRLMGAVQGFRFSLPSVETLHRELFLLHKPDLSVPAPVPPFATALTLDHVSFKYAGSDHWALNDVSITVNRGSSIGFVGASGAGKSTLVDVVLGLLTPWSGAVSVDGSDIQQGLRGWQNQVGYVPQAIFLTDDTLRRNVALGLPDERIDESAVWRALRFAQLDRFVADLPQGLDTFVGERGVRLSGGQRQRIGIARALYHDPAVLVLDEATSSLDIHTERGFLDAVRALRGDKTLLIVAHRLSAVERCDRVYRLENGNVIEHGATDTVLARMRTTALV